MKNKINSEINKLINERAKELKIDLKLIEIVYNQNTGHRIEVKEDNGIYELIEYASKLNNERYEK